MVIYPRALTAPHKSVLAILDLGVTVNTIPIIMAKTTEKARSAITGKFVTEKYAESHPKTTVVEKVKVGPVKHRK